MSSTPDPNTVKFLLEMVRDPEDDSIRSSHHPATLEDQTRMGEWPSGGLVHAAHAMFIEMLRREAYTMAVVMVANGDKAENMTAEDLEQRVRMRIAQMAETHARDMCEETMTFLREQDAGR